jgi:hypothetical protein
MPAIEAGAVRHEQADRGFGNEIVFNGNKYAHVCNLIEEPGTIPPVRSATSMT